MRLLFIACLRRGATFGTGTFSATRAKAHCPTNSLQPVALQAFALLAFDTREPCLALKSFTRQVSLFTCVT